MKKFLRGLKFIGLFVFALLIANVNACSKKGDSNNAVSGWGFQGGTTFGTGIGQTSDGAILGLQFVISPSGQVGAQGYLVIPPQGLVGCMLPPGGQQFSLVTQVPGTIMSGDQFSNIQMVSTQGGLPVMVAQTILWSDLVQNQFYGVSHRMYAVVNIPGCPLTFD